MTLMKLRPCSRCGGKSDTGTTCTACQKALRLRREYNLSPEELADLIAATKGRCPICRKATEQWVIDHDHACCPGRRSCGRCVRGVLCHGCNRMLGIANDSVTRLERAIRYLRRSR